MQVPPLLALSVPSAQVVLDHTTPFRLASVRVAPVRLLPVRSLHGAPSSREPCPRASLNPPCGTRRRYREHSPLSR